MNVEIDKECQPEIHNKHEELAEKIYSTPGMLPVRYVYIITNSCNLKCKWCYLDKHRRKDAMSLEQWINLSEQLPDYARVTITGGEPLLYHKFKELFSFVAERHDCNVITNGLSLTKDISDFLLSYPKFRVLAISVDNIRNTIREIKPEKWKKAEEQIRYFSEKKKKINPDCILDIKTTVLDENAEQLFDIYKYCVEDLNCDTHVFQFLKGSPLQHANSLFEFDDIFKRSKAVVFESERFEIVREQLDKIKQYNKKNRKVSFLHPKGESLISGDSKLKIDYLNEPFYAKENYMLCKYPWAGAHINVNGNLFPCLAIPIGNVKEKSLVEIINGKEMTRFREIIKKEGTVAACHRCGWSKPKVI